MKTLEQIQEENRKAIIMANNPSAKDKPLTLDRVLIGASKVSLTYYPHSNGLNLNSHIIWELLAMWNLTKPTLEDQSEKTQRVINKLFII
jgi:hypothetical protein